MGKLFGDGQTAATREQDLGAVTMDWLVEDALLPEAGLSVARMTVAPGAISEGHRHPNCNEVIHLLSGRVEQWVDNNRFIMEPGDTVLIRQGSSHRIRNLGAEPAVMIVSYSSGSRVYQAENADTDSAPV